MKHNIIQMTATAVLTINPIFQYILDCLGFNPMNGNFDFVFQSLNHPWILSVMSPWELIEILYFYYKINREQFLKKSKSLYWKCEQFGKI